MTQSDQSNRLTPHQQRVVTEKIELDERRDKLDAFLAGEIFPTLPVPEQERLRRQATIMREYSIVLTQRIQAWRS